MKGVKIVEALVRVRFVHVDASISTRPDKHEAINKEMDRLTENAEHSCGFLDAMLTVDTACPAGQYIAASMLMAATEGYLRGLGHRGFKAIPRSGNTATDLANALSYKDLICHLAEHAGSELKVAVLTGSEADANRD